MKKTIEKVTQMKEAMEAAVEQNRIAAERLCSSIKQSSGTIKKALTK